jgi:hypothetical protein
MAGRAHGDVFAAADRRHEVETTRVAVEGAAAQRAVNEIALRGRNDLEVLLTVVRARPITGRRKGDDLGHHFLLLGGGANVRGSRRDTLSRHIPSVLHAVTPLLPTRWEEA